MWDSPNWCYITKSTNPFKGFRFTWNNLSGPSDSGWPALHRKTTVFMTDHEWSTCAQEHWNPTSYPLLRETLLRLPILCRLNCTEVTTQRCSYKIQRKGSHFTILFSSPLVSNIICIFHGIPLMFPYMIYLKHCYFHNGLGILFTFVACSFHKLPAVDKFSEKAQSKGICLDVWKILLAGLELEHRPLNSPANIVLNPNCYKYMK